MWKHNIAAEIRVLSSNLLTTQKIKIFFKQGRSAKPTTEYVEPIEKGGAKAVLSRY